MAQLIKVASWDGTRGHVIFIHGLGGHAYDTWRREKNMESFWPLWLARDLEGVTVWTLDYAAPPTNWLGNALPLQDRAVTVLERLLTEPELKDGPITFVCHSLGGLIVKQLFREIKSQQSHRPDAGTLSNRMKAVVFFATPHTGSTQASLLDRLRLIAWPSTAALDLTRNDPNLRNLNVWYRNHSMDVSHKIFYETHSTSAGTIVDAGSADAGLPNVVPIPVEADHQGVCKPSNPGDLSYSATKSFLENKVFFESKDPQKYKNLTFEELHPIQRSKPATLAPIILRLSFLALIAGSIFYFTNKNQVADSRQSVEIEGNNDTVKQTQKIKGKSAEQNTKVEGNENDVVQEIN